MIKLISGKVACSLCGNNKLSQDYELYEYATYIVLSALLHISTVVVLGLIFNLVVESIIFYCSFVAIRKFAGGYHAKTPIRCYIFSTFTITIGLIIYKFLESYDNLIITILIMLITLGCSICIFMLAPLDNENNPLSNKEKQYYRIISIINMLILFISSIILLLLKTNYGFAIILGISMSAIVLIMRKIQIVLSLRAK